MLLQITESCIGLFFQHLCASTVHKPGLSLFTKKKRKRKKLKTMKKENKNVWTRNKRKYTEWMKYLWTLIRKRKILNVETIFLLLYGSVSPEDLQFYRFQAIHKNCWFPVTWPLIKNAATHFIFCSMVKKNSILFLVYSVAWKNG